MNSTISSFFEFDSHELMEKKSTLRALNLKKDSMAVEIATKLDLTGYFGLEEIDFDDPRLADIKDEFFKIISKINSCSWEVDRLEALRDGELPRHEARKKVYTFLNRLGNDQATDFLKSYQLSTVSLTEAVLICPTLLDDLMNFEENLEIIRSNPKVWW